MELQKSHPERDNPVLERLNMVCIHLFVDISH